jgi:ubiquinone/menaquinone biosynthesis C-methylase UbiE
MRIINVEALAKSTIGHFLIRVLGAIMESRFRYRFFSPTKILLNADLKPGQKVLEVGCGTGFFTLPAARLIGENGSLVAIDILSESVEMTSERVRVAGLRNVRVIKSDVLNMPQEEESFDVIILFGVIPAPMLPLARLLPEMSRLLKPRGVLTVWPPIPGWLPQSILKSKLFTYLGKRKGVHKFRRIEHHSDKIGSDAK